MIPLSMLKRHLLFAMATKALPDILAFILILRKEAKSSVLIAVVTLF